MTSVSQKEIPKPVLSLTMKFCVLVAALVLPVGGLLAQGSLSPAGAPAPVMKSLGQIEPRIPISTAGFTITNAGSYYLTTNLTGGASTSGVSVSANNVTLDLNGFTLFGTAPNSIDGVLIGAQTNVTVRNGSCVGWGDSGVAAYNSHGCKFQNLTLLGNGTGLGGNSGMIVRDCVTESNLYDGFDANDRCQFFDCSSSFNGNDGFSMAGGGCQLIRCNGSANHLRGFYLAVGNMLQACTAYGNTNRGVEAGAAQASHISDCTFTGNGTDGIGLGSGSTLVNCTSDNNGTLSSAAGIRVNGTGNRVEGNHVWGNTAFGIFSSGGNNLIIRNSARTLAPQTTSYNIAAGNVVGPIITSTTIGTNSSPHANFELN